MCFVLFYGKLITVKIEVLGGGERVCNHRCAKVYKKNDYTECVPQSKNRKKWERFKRCTIIYMILSYLYYLNDINISLFNFHGYLSISAYCGNPHVNTSSAVISVLEQRVGTIDFLVTVDILYLLRSVY